jgi:hypothetical protein
MEASQAICDVPADWVIDFSQCLYEWQGLEAAGLAVVATAIGATMVLRQISQTREHREDEIARKHRAARLSLPLSLSAVSDLVQNIADNLADEFEQYVPNLEQKDIGAILDGRASRTRFDPVSLPHEVIQSFERFVESLEREEDIRHVAELMASIQILVSRYNSFDLNSAGARLGLVGRLLDAAKVKLLNEKIFNYARFVDDGKFGIVGSKAQKKTWDEIHGAAQKLVFLRRRPDLFFPDLQEKIEGYKSHNINPWNEKFA